MKAMLEVSHIRKKYGKKQILNDISFQADCGQCIAIVGKNGCGKSTLLQIMSGIIKPNGGNIYYFEKEVIHNRRLFRKYCGYVPQENPLIEELTVKDNLKFWGWDTKEKIEEQLEIYDIMEKKVSILSGGMKRRLSIACSLIHHPPIVILDEPTTSLDIYYKEGIQAWIRQYCNQGGIVVMTTHEEKEIINADRCMVILGGRLEEITYSATRMKKVREYIVNNEK